MNIEIKTFIEGPLENNIYLIIDSLYKNAVVIDPSFDCQSLISYVDFQNLVIRQIWITHAHFDHIIGTKDFLAKYTQPIEIALHPDDLNLWNSGGGGKHFGLPSPSNPPPTISLSDSQILQIGDSQWQVLHTPGHTRGSVVFYCAEMKAAFCGDLIFQGSVGRTDLPGSSSEKLLQSIHSKILTLPLDTILYPGHGLETTVGEEKSTNPFLT
jgi:glyoxylase-like metal-dependent hydrolase (beta-lactamase superfamily II)